MANSESLFLKACRREPVPRTPVWFMRQAGRYMDEYQQLRRRYSLLEICRTPELAAEVTFQPLRRFRLDAGIVFADILLPLEGMGLDFGFEKGRGPVIREPVRSEEQIDRLRVFDPGDELGFVLRTLELVRRELSPEIALIGFAGGPFTIASYMVEGGSSRDHRLTKTLMYQHEEAWNRMLDKIARVTVRYLQGQIAAGADAVQLFDSWAGALSPDDYRRYVLPHSRRVLKALAGEGVPLIHFATCSAGLLELLREAGGTVIGVDWRIELAEAWDRLGPDVAVQGNLDPVALLGPRERLLQKVDHVLDQVRGRAGHVFNLGHGILPMTPVDKVEAAVERVRRRSAVEGASRPG